MNKILYTQRVEIVEGYGERRDCADQNIARFLYVCGFMPIPVMNVPDIAIIACETIGVDGILFTGGNDLVAYGGNAPERDETEKELLEYAIKKGIPLLGICRGMQMIAHYYGAELEKVEGHIRKEHALNGRICRDAVNSFHGMGIRAVGESLEELARTDDGVIEAIVHRENKIAGIMWHPERVENYSKEDMEMVKRFYREGRLV